ncbi:hypothetical protein [Flavimaricola marinus]|uniref:Uncharacterized protein n=1 Tax=Flavimaricola marinus TaxID=1819565 RepID=A0A238LHI6_9RHOB|nr:hypothetical protein [Flavimaricola marinus]SMY09003.1 hypothetical protein LOM8899_03163 [Flavimaricola marinus]
MRLGLVVAMAAVTLLSGCEIFLDGLGFEMFQDATGVDVTVAAPEAYQIEGL